MTHEKPELLPMPDEIFVHRSENTRSEDGTPNPDFLWISYEQADEGYQPYTRYIRADRPAPQDAGVDVKAMLKEAADPDCYLCDGGGIFYGNVCICQCVNRTRTGVEQGEGGDKCPDCGAEMMEVCSGLEHISEDNSKCRTHENVRFLEAENAELKNRLRSQEITGGVDVKITERGFAGHFICSTRCLFRRNTLIECGDRKIVVSTVGNMLMDHGKHETIGLDRYYETMAFEAVFQDGYWEADIGNQLSFESEWTIADLKQESDAAADKMHDAVVREFVTSLIKATPQPAASDQCIDEGCPHHGKAIKCEPKDGGCTATVAAPDAVQELVEALDIAVNMRKNPEGQSYEAVKAFIDKADALIAKHSKPGER